MRFVISCIVAIGFLTSPVAAGGDANDPGMKARGSYSAPFSKNSGVKVTHLQPMTIDVGGNADGDTQQPAPRYAYAGSGGYGGYNGYGNSNYGGGYGGYGFGTGFGGGNKPKKDRVYGFAGPRRGVTHLQPVSRPAVVPVYKPIMKPQRPPMPMKPMMKPTAKPMMKPAMMPAAKPAMRPAMRPRPARKTM